MAYGWVWDGGRPCLDLVNTLRDRWGAGHELLREPADLARWLRAAELSRSRVRVRPGHLDAARELREAVDVVVRAAATGRRPAAAGVRVLNRWAAERPAPRLRVGRAGGLRHETATPQAPVAAAFGMIAVDAIDLVTADLAAQVRVCASHSCGIRFLDRSPAGNRRWCSMARCGNRQKARQHYARSRPFGRTEESAG